MSEQKSMEHLPVPSSSDDSLRLSSRDRDEADIRDGVNWLLDLLPSRRQDLAQRLMAWEREAIDAIEHTR